MLSQGVPAIRFSAPPQPSVEVTRTIPVIHPTYGHYVVRQPCRLHSVSNQTDHPVVCQVIQPPNNRLTMQFLIPAFNMLLNMWQHGFILEPGAVITTFVVDTKTGKAGRSYKFTKNYLTLQTVPSCD